MKILCTHPGRYGDLLWALPTVRALAESYDAPVDLLLGPAYSMATFRSLLTRQRYLGKVMVADDWTIVESAPITPREPPTLPAGYGKIVHLAYEGWPSDALPYETFRLACKQVPIDVLMDLDRPWIEPEGRHQLHWDLAVGFSDEYFEVKYGVFQLLKRARLDFNLQEVPDFVNVSGHPYSHWSKAGGTETCDWEMAASRCNAARLFIGCCSALHVLALAVGKKVVLVEPNPMRHHDIFYPYGKTGRVQLVLGSDAQPTVDYRHVFHAVNEALQLLELVQ